jgi:hypothetical protein
MNLRAVAKHGPDLRKMSKHKVRPCDGWRSPAQPRGQRQEDAEEYDDSDDPDPLSCSVAFQTITYGQLAHGTL